MTHGFKDKNKKFHPITKIKGIRKKKSPSDLQGVKIVKYIDPKTKQSKEMMEGISQSFARQPESVKKKVKTIVLRPKEENEDFVALTDSIHGIVFFNQKDDLTKEDYEALGDHEFEHIDFAKHLNDKDKEYLEFVINGNRIMPFTPSLVSTMADQEEAFIQGNFGILPDKRLEYPDEINSVVTEIETRNKLGLPNQILNEEEFRKAKDLVDKLHKKPQIGKSEKPDSAFDSVQLSIGTKIELEHTDDPEIAKRIAKDHLEESPRYYMELQKLEKKLEVKN